MAETTRSLDYSGGSMLDRYAAARKKQATGGASVDIGGVISGVGEVVSQAAQVEKAKEEAQDLALANWDKGFDAMGDRGSWASPQLFDQFQDLESTFRDQYIAAVESGDKKLQQSLLTQQGNRASSLQAWTETMEAAAQINNGPGWGHAVTSNTEHKALLEALAKNDGSAKPVVGEGGELMFEFNGKRYSRRDVDDMVASGTFPSAMKKDFLNGAADQLNTGLKGGYFDQELTYQTNLNSLSDENMSSYIHDPVTGATSFAQDIMALEGSEFTAIKGFKFDPIPVEEGGVLDPNDDGQLTAEDFKVEGADIKTMLEMIESDPKIGRPIIAEYLTLKQKANFDRGEAEYKRRLKESDPTADMTAQEKIDYYKELAAAKR